MQTRKKRLIIDHPYIGAIIMVFLLFKGIPMLGSVSGLILAQAININTQYALLLCVSIVSMIILLLYRLWLRKEPFKGVMSVTGRGAGAVYRLAAIAFAVDVICIAAIMFFDYGGIGNLVMPSVSTFLVSLCAGTFEETAFRAIPLSILMKNRPTEKRIILAVVITAFIFGAVHMTNIRMGAAFGISLYQSFQAMIIGAMFAAFYLRTGSILVPMVYHFMHDMVSQMIPTQSTGVMLQQTISMGTLIPDIVIMICEIAVTVYLLRKGVLEEIKETWRDKWSEECE